MCLYLQEESCFCINQLGIVRDAAKKLQDLEPELYKYWKQREPGLL